MKHGALRLNRKQLSEFIEAIRAEGGDPSELQREMEALEPPTPPREAKAGSSDIVREELTTEERLDIEVGDLFAGGITGELLAWVIELDRNHSLEELRAMCREAGLSPNGHKKKLAAFC